ncbi:hypothetical protein BX616_001572 [Lobosporangium transversale]|nr:hypothetical protein BX616_001572 [Lobosporangium transversale]
MHATRLQLTFLSINHADDGQNFTPLHPQRGVYRIPSGQKSPEDYRPPQKGDQEKKENAFRGINADRLILHKVSVPGQGTTVNLANVDSKEPLTRVTREITKAFGTAPPKGAIHIIVQRPSAVINTLISGANRGYSL